MAEGRRYSVASAVLTSYLATECWDAAAAVHRYGADQLAVHLDLELHVDGRSGGDGELAPDIRLEIRDLPLPPLAQLVGQRLDRLGTASGWFGNDAPPFDGVTITLESLPDPTTAILAVEASYRWRPDRRSQRLRFRGPVAVAPLRFQVKDPDDAPELLERAFGADWAEHLELAEDGVLDLPTAAPPDRRRWHRYRARPR